MELFNQLLNSINGVMYGSILIGLLVFSGIYFTIRTKFVQIRLFPEALKVITEGKKGEHSVSSFQALMISTASRVGTGNIAGVATAVVSGGPGAIFWMWVMAIIGSSSAFIESTLAQVYKVKKGKQFRGGPAYYIEKALGLRWLGVIFAILLISCFAYGFNGLQSYTISSAFEYYVGTGYSDSIYPIIVGFVLAILTALVIYGGVKRISFITSVIVPIMALIYLALGVFITLTNLDMFPKMFSLIIDEAFNFRAIAGGFAGSFIAVGIKRGLFSNEGGMGSAPNAAATADVSHPVKQGLVQMLSVFIDTLLICTTTAFMLLISGVQGSEELTGLPFVQAAVNSQIGEFGIHFITFSIFAFAFSSIIGNYYYAESNMMFIKENKVVLNIFRTTVVAMVFAGANSDLETAWNLADVLMSFMATVNIVVILLLGNKAIKVLKDYDRQKKEGIDPHFVATKVGIENAEIWD